MKKTIIIICILVVGLATFYYLNNRQEKINNIQALLDVASDGGISENMNLESVNSSSTLGTGDTLKVNEDAFGKIKKVYIANGKLFVDIDYIEIKHSSTSMPWGSISNVNPKIRTFEISPKATILLTNQYVDGVLTTGLYKITPNEFKLIFNSPKEGDFRILNPWKISVKDNVILLIEEVFRS